MKIGDEMQTPNDSRSDNARYPSPPGYLVLDTESVPDGKLIARVQYPDETVSPEEAVQRAQAEARDRSYTNSDFLPVTFQYPVGVCVLRVGVDFSLQALTCLDSPQFRPRQIAEEFWKGLANYKSKYRERIKLVTFNGRTFDLPLMELAAFRYGCGNKEHFQNSRNRFGGGHIDLMELMSNYAAIRFAGGLNLLSKLLGNPGKMGVSGDKVYEMFLAGKIQDINDYCMFDTLDTYFVFLRTRVLVGEIDLAEEHRLVMNAKEWLEQRAKVVPVLSQYLENWGDWNPWP